jgi:uncharacterized membrane protein YgdD (TMEM256/DUF423 family)
MIKVGSLWMSMAVMIGAFGAHGLRGRVTDQLMATFETGSKYHIYHALGILLLGVLCMIKPQLKLKPSFMAFNLGILLFSMNCYLYVITGEKIFAMLVPIGGVSFIVGWFMLYYTSIRPAP